MEKKSEFFSGIFFLTDREPVFLCVLLLWIILNVVSYTIQAITGYSQYNHIENIIHTIQAMSRVVTLLINNKQVFKLLLYAMIYNDSQSSITIYSSNHKISLTIQFFTLISFIIYASMQDHTSYSFLFTLIYLFLYPPSTFNQNNFSIIISFFFLYFSNYSRTSSSFFFSTITWTPTLIMSYLAKLGINNYEINNIVRYIGHPKTILAPMVFLTCNTFNIAIFPISVIGGSLRSRFPNACAWLWMWFMLYSHVPL